MPKIEELIRKQIEDNKKSHYQKNREAGGNVEQREKFLDAKAEMTTNSMKKGGLAVKRKGVKNFKKGLVTIKNKKNPKYFIGGLLGIGAGLLGGGPLGMGIGALKKKKDEKQKQGSGRILKVRVIGEGGGVGEKVNEKKLKEDKNQSSEEAKAQAEGVSEEQNTAGASARKGAIIKKRRFVKKYKEGGEVKVEKPRIDMEKPSKIDLKVASESKPLPDLKINKSFTDTTSAVDTNRGPNMLSRQDLARQHKINKQKKFDDTVRRQKRAQGTIGPPKHVEQAKVAARMNPVSALFAGPSQAIQHRQQKNRQANNKQATMKKGGIAKRKRRWAR